MREALVEHVRLIQVQVPGGVTERGVDQRDVRAEGRDGDELLAGERAGDTAVLGVQAQQVGTLQPADGQERHAHLRRPQLGQDRHARALPDLQRPALGRAAERGRKAQILLEPDVALLADGDGADGDEQVGVDAVRRPDDPQAAPALADELADQRHGQPGREAPAEGDGGAVRDAGDGVRERRALVGPELEARHGGLTAPSSRRRA